MLTTQDVFKKRKRTTFLLILVIGGLYGIFSHVIGLQGLGMAFLESPQGFAWLFYNFIPTEESIAILPTIIETLWRTAMLAITATFTAAIAAMILAVIGSKKIGIHPVVIYLVRGVAMFSRNIPLAVWAMLLLVSFRQNEFTGYLALFFGTLGILTRSFVEIVDEASEGSVEALRATGASYFQIVFQGVIPMISSQGISWILFMIEANIREATLVGILTGTGIGFLFDLYFRSFRYQEAGMVILVIVITVLALELLSNKIRRLII